MNYNQITSARGNLTCKTKRNNFQILQGLDHSFVFYEFVDNTDKCVFMIKRKFYVALTFQLAMIKNIVAVRAALPKKISDDLVRF